MKRASMRPSTALAMRLALALVLSLAADSIRAQEPPPAERPTPEDAAAPAKKRPPNILVILADDLGFSDLGCYGGEIETPQLDGLSRNGLRFTQFYNTGRCWPTRAAAMTGYYPQQVRRDRVPGVRSGGRGTRPDWAPLLPRRLGSRGYRSYHSGKWHIDGMPIAGGFDRSYYLRDQGRFFSPRVHWEDDVKLPPVERGESPWGQGYYGTTAIADHAIKCLREHAEKHVGSPFFHYLAFTAPHFPLHALEDDFKRCRPRYRHGWDLARAARWDRIVELGLVPGAALSPVELDVGPPYHFPKALARLGPGEVNRPLHWSDLDARQRAFQADKMALHAAMIERMDREIGRVLDQLRKMGAFDNTLILFFSDNGASAEIMVRDDGHDPAAPPGSGASYLCLGPGWSTTSNTPFRRHKTWVHEGGIATPLVAHWPEGIAARGELRGVPAHAIDLVPTILELAGVDATAGVPEAAESKKASAVPALPGRSLVPAFAGDTAVERPHLWWLHEGNRAIRAGDWKLVAAKGDPWELYDLSRDRTETRNLAGTMPEKVRELAALWEREHTRFIEQAGGKPERK